MKITPTHVGLFVVLLAVAGGIYVFSQQKKEPAQQSSESQEVFSIAGSVQSVDADKNSFIVQESTNRQDVTVIVGDNTQMIRLSFPFDLNNPPEEASFVPEQEEVVLNDIKKGDQVFVRSSHVVKTGQDIINPLEVQVLP
ncbi:MAG: hypothetical protein A3J68_02370 [Candidatus Wildermuthbacteria bacterium RIFCSPHIGHO2_02_FULL_48_16]|uniref:DUF5666 domain-containing protein n=1 Tax=Candidatus Wildermuthbacteria bacterium RIFCSPHIGHO2_02_FULL_48_16 TaxID=1802453 RepID=A0A1G2R8Z3_9BACT|nr:MAG: hypothetical protein A3J68_02370 [Candidatus Wildermuthbacteria bacterium RIFCSPHIGHO2_02_FULL_48_16]